MAGRIGIVPRIAFELLFRLVDLGPNGKGPGIERHRVIEHGQAGQVMNQADGERVAILPLVIFLGRRGFDRG
jgi:hypothetical protein